MVLLLHIFIALLSIIIATANLVRPNKRLLQAGFLLTISTILSGSLLVISGSSSNLKQICFTGLAYLGFTVSLLLIGKQRLATIPIKSQIRK